MLKVALKVFPGGSFNGGVRVRSLVQVLRSHMPPGQKIKQRQYCNEVNKNLKNGPHQKNLKKKVASEPAPTLVSSDADCDESASSSFPFLSPSVSCSSFSTLLPSFPGLPAPPPPPTEGAAPGRRPRCPRGTALGWRAVLLYLLCPGPRAVCPLGCLAFMAPRRVRCCPPLGSWQASG